MVLFFIDEILNCMSILFVGGAQIIDMMMLVVDVTKGMQTQTAECLVIGEILCNKMIVVLNKIDLLDESKRGAAIEKVSTSLFNIFGIGLSFNGYI